MVKRYFDEFGLVAGLMFIGLFGFCGWWYTKELLIFLQKI